MSGGIGLPRRVTPLRGATPRLFSIYKRAKPRPHQNTAPRRTHAPVYPAVADLPAHRHTWAEFLYE